MLIAILLVSVVARPKDESSKGQNQNRRKVVSKHDGNFTRIMERIATTPNRCLNFPNATAIVTTATGAIFDLLLIRRQVVPVSSRPFDEAMCMNKLTFVVCLDTACMRLCKQHKMRGCMRYPTGSYPLVEHEPLPFKTNEWRLTTYLKFEVFDAAFSQGMESILMIDADVLIFRNPFTNMMANYHKYDILHQSEGGGGCDARVNSGVLLMRNTPKGAAVLKGMLAKKDEILKDTDVLEQHILQDIISKEGAARCSLPITLYTGHCQYAHIDNTLTSDIVTYHAHCTENQAEKIALMYHFMTMSNIPNMTFNEAEYSRNYFDKALSKTDPEKPRYNDQ